MTGKPTREPRRAFRWRPADFDEGFSLIEVAVALVIAVVLMIGLTVTVANSLRAVRQNRSLQQANSLTLERIEYVRSLAWDNVAMDTPALTSDPLLLSPLDRRIIGSEVDLLANELFVEDTTDGWVDTYRTEVFDEQAFEVRTYITEVTPDLRRVVAVVDWVNGNADRQTFATALISKVSADS